MTKLFIMLETFLLITSNKQNNKYKIIMVNFTFNFKRIFFIITGLYIILSPYAGFTQTKSKEINHEGITYKTYDVEINGKTLSDFNIHHNEFSKPHQEVVKDIENYFDSLQIDNSIFLTNPGIVVDGCEPIGLFINDFQVKNQINSKSGTGNFYSLQPNGALLIAEDEAIICNSDQIQYHSNTRIGLQSGPMLVSDGKINLHFNPNSKNTFLRNGVGIYKDNKGNNHLIFVISSLPVSFYEFSDLFLSRLNCQNALCLESSRSVMNIPYLDKLNQNENEIICHYLAHKTIKGKGRGSGFLLSDQGLIATNYHVIEGGTNFIIKGVDGDFSKAFNAKIEAIDKVNDIALLKINDASFVKAELPPYKINESTVKVGSQAYALGYPIRSVMGDEIKFTDGRISAKSGINGSLNSYSITVPIQPGNSGGPLFDFEGNIIGITSHQINKKNFNTENANYAIKSNYLLNLIEMLDYQPNLPTQNSISALKIPDQVNQIKNSVFSIEVDY
tara:strand:- start:1672 stop:3180 length:1509 start_codon:yes stop_codon:yes gene_type:complete